MKLLKGLRELMKAKGPGIVKAIPERKRGTNKQRILERISAMNGPSVARLMLAYIDMYPFQEIANAPGMYFVPDHNQIKGLLSVSTETYWKMVNVALDAGYLKKEKIGKMLMFEIQFRALDALLEA